MKIAQQRIWLLNISRAASISSLFGSEENLEDEVDDADFGEEDEEDIPEDLIDDDSDTVEIRFATDSQATLQQALELFEASRTALGFDEADAVVGIVLEEGTVFSVAK